MSRWTPPGFAFVKALRYVRPSMQVKEKDNPFSCECSIDSGVLERICLQNIKIVAINKTEPYKEVQQAITRAKHCARYFLKKIKKKKNKRPQPKVVRIKKQKDKNKTLNLKEIEYYGK